MSTPDVRTTETQVAHSPEEWKLQQTSRDQIHIFVTPKIGAHLVTKVIATLECGFKEPFESQQQANAILILYAPELLALARKFASECAECGGLGYEMVDTGMPVESRVDCRDCADIWVVINKAEGK